MVRELEALYGGAGTCLLVPVSTGLELEREWNRMNDSQTISAVVIQGHGDANVISFTLPSGERNKDANDMLYTTTIERMHNKNVNTVMLISCNNARPLGEGEQNVAQAFLAKKSVSQVIAASGSSQLTYELVTTKKSFFSKATTTQEFRIRVGISSESTNLTYTGYMLLNKDNPSGKSLKDPFSKPISPFIPGNSDYPAYGDSDSEYKYEYKGLTELIDLSKRLK